MDSFGNYAITFPEGTWARVGMDKGPDKGILIQVLSYDPDPKQNNGYFLCLMIRDDMTRFYTGHIPGYAINLDVIPKEEEIALWIQMKLQS